MDAQLLLDCPRRHHAGGILGHGHAGRACRFPHETPVLGTDGVIAYRVEVDGTVPREPRDPTYELLHEEPALGKAITQGLAVEEGQVEELVSRLELISQQVPLAGILVEALEAP